MNLFVRSIALALALLILAAPAGAQGKKKPQPAGGDGEEEYYKLLRFEVPPGEVLEAGGIEMTPDGKFVPTTSGVRSPGGVGFDAEGNVFYSDNQGPWNGACSLKQLTVGGFVGHPDGFKWYKDRDAQYLGAAPLVPKSGSRIMT